ncbi:uncharacterized protein DUF3891 [Humitalea rosea]|uniref:Uncharacterized protein DUF3891 n=1 Tax=Humitalea rosea TaxID=990373 RepID=A0A2W7ILV5_9PROT|nr:DUF3891 family protein [Humitalea rosea]PZW46741.1 uncharacterized protein DUF3891 [Humitalea rosea]
MVADPIVPPQHGRMLLQTLPDGDLLCISQPAHAVVSGQLARAWGAPGFHRPAPLEPVVLACAQHDIAWLDWELAPGFDAETGQPRGFRHVGARIHAPMWSLGVDRALAAWGLWPALLISRHGTLIYTRFMDRHRVAAEDAAAADAYMAEQAVRQADWISQLGASEAEVAANSALLAAVDQMSLVICWGDTTEAGTVAGHAPTADGGTRPLTFRRAGPRALICDPWPFLGDALRVETEVRRLPAPATYPDAAAMGAALAAAPWETLAVTLHPA